MKMLRLTFFTGKKCPQNQKQMKKKKKNNLKTFEYKFYLMKNYRKLKTMQNVFVWYFQKSIYLLVHYILALFLSLLYFLGVCRLRYYVTLQYKGLFTYVSSVISPFSEDIQHGGQGILKP